SSTSRLASSMSATCPVSFHQPLTTCDSTRLPGQRPALAVTLGPDVWTAFYAGLREREPLLGSSVCLYGPFGLAAAGPFVTHVLRPRHTRNRVRARLAPAADREWRRGVRRPVARARAVRLQDEGRRASSPASPSAVPLVRARGV